MCMAFLTCNNVTLFQPPVMSEYEFDETMMTNSDPRGNIWRLPLIMNDTASLQVFRRAKVITIADRGTDRLIMF